VSNIRHHPGDSTLLSYASGALPHGLSLIVAAHLCACPQCRETVALGDGIGGALIEDAAPVRVSDRSLDLVLQRIESDQAENETQQPVENGRHGVPAPLGALLPENLSDVRWRSIGPGIRQAKMPGHDGQDEGVKLLKIAPGRSVPQHSHGGHEMTLIVCGSYTDEIGRFQAGDIADLDGDVRHQPVADSAEDCVCIIATDAPLNFTGLVPRLMQNFIRI
jgi:putative transcriptional regulator